MDEYYFSGFQDYIKSLCETHTDLLHAADNQAFIHFQSDNEVSGLFNNPSPNLVLFSRFYGRAQGASADTMQMKQFASIRFACYAVQPVDGNITGSIADALDKAFSIMMDFIAKMVKDQRDDTCGALRRMELETCSWSEIPDQPFIENHFGWELSIPFSSEFPAYNAAKWN
jgi:hypothetical protein